MSFFVFSVDGTGEDSTYVKIDGENATEARRVLESRGHRNVQLIEDEEDIALRRRIGAQEAADEDIARLKSFEAECRQLTRRQFYWQKVLKPNMPILTLLTALVAFRIWRGGPWNWWSLATYAVAGSIILDCVLRLLPGALYARLLEARAWHNDDTIISTLRILRALPKRLRGPIPDFELDFSEANVIARRGKINEAVALVQKYETDPNHQGGAYYARLASVYGSGRRFDEQIDCCRRALALSPNSTSNIISLAQPLVERFGSLPEAVKLLDSVPETELKPLPWIYYLFSRGLIALAEKDFSRASECFSNSRERAIQHGTNELLKGFTRKIQGYEALALTHLGEKESARRLWEPVANFLEATGQIELRDAWRSAHGES